MTLTKALVADYFMGDPYAACMCYAEFCVEFGKDEMAWTMDEFDEMFRRDPWYLLHAYGDFTDGVDPYEHEFVVKNARGELRGVSGEEMGEIAADKLLYGDPNFFEALRDGDLDLPADVKRRLKGAGASKNARKPSAGARKPSVKRKAPQRANGTSKAGKPATGRPNAKKRTGARR